MSNIESWTGLADYYRILFHIIVESIVLLLDAFFNLYCRNALKQVRHISRHLYILGVCMFVCLGIRVFQDFFIAGVSLLMCSYLQGAVRYWQQSLGPDFVYLLYRHFFHLCFCRFVFFCAVLCREGGALAAPGDILAGICLPLGEKYPNTANNLKEM